MVNMEWFPAITTTSILVFAAWMARNLIATRLKSSVEHEFNGKLAGLENELKTKSAEIEAMRHGALTAMSGRQAAIDKRRLEAVDQIWASATSLGRVKMAISMLTVLKLDAIHDALASRDANKMRQFINAIALAPDATTLDFASAAKAHPFVTPMVWASYSALAAVSGHAIGQWTALKAGVNPKDLMNEDAVKKLVKLALPTRIDYIEEHGAIAAYHLVEELESQLLTEIRLMLNGADDDKASVERAAQIVAHAKKVAEAAATATNAGAAAAAGVMV